MHLMMSALDRCIPHNKKSTPLFRELRAEIFASPGSSTQNQTPRSDLLDFTWRLPDKGNGCRVINTPDIEVKRVKNDLIVSSIEDDELKDLGLGRKGRNGGI